MRAIDADELMKLYENTEEFNIDDFKVPILVVRQNILDMPTIDVVSKGLFEQIKWERDIAISQLEELGLSLGQKIEYANVVPKEQYEDLKEAFVDFACSGINNLAPYCKNNCEECIDGRGWCIYERCNGFNPDGRANE